MTQFKLVAMGGTFDLIHAGHTALLDRAFSISSGVIIGLTSDSLAARKGKKPRHTYQQRFDILESLLKKRFAGKSYTISPLDDDFGPAVLEKEVEALIVSDETAHQGDVLNLKRSQKGLDPVQVITVPMVLASDGNRISSTRIRNSEIDPQGNLLKS
ncbi:phosphopantetheine adenylyltransferase [Candidatus Nitrosotenuis sp. DW1]|uniref:phosphopantetheine adenylyltransferase n=1 Tax=Candidatus Nitrosotenuis sp. DW1 TaxID=2259672 RepID=UPI0015CDED7E|nr:pantetheine-phosphate adenylyltransferase [Candidatus Nitrosotenuis sp. DW1]QLH09490.1 cytidyltransferase [Candidatus Nitrosotenuis sp. DW1]